MPFDIAHLKALHEKRESLLAERAALSLDLTDWNRHNAIDDELKPVERELLAALPDLLAKLDRTL